MSFFYNPHLAFPSCVLFWRLPRGAWFRLGTLLPIRRTGELRRMPKPVLEGQKPGSQITLRDSVAIPEDVVFRELDGEVVLLNLNSGIYFGLNEMGTRIWQLLQEQGHLQTVSDDLRTEYEASEDVIEKDLLVLVGALCEKGLVRVVEPKTS